jgi:hypothetical protein
MSNKVKGVNRLNTVDFISEKLFDTKSAKSAVASLALTTTFKVVKWTNNNKAWATVTTVTNERNTADFLALFTDSSAPLVDK